MADTKNSWTVSKVCNKITVDFFPKEKYKKTIYFGKLTADNQCKLEWTGNSTEDFLIATNALLTDYSLLTNCKSALLSHDDNQSHYAYIHLHWWHSISPLLNTRKAIIIISSTNVYNTLKWNKRVFKLYQDVHERG